MTRLAALALVLAVPTSCSVAPPPDAGTEAGGAAGPAVGCDGQRYAPVREGLYVLPFPVGTRYRMSLGNCSSSFHGPLTPDQYAYDFVMEIGTPITASRAGTVVHVEASGRDGGFPNNLVVVRHDDDTYAQYMHLTQGGADVRVGDRVAPGDPIGRSGNTGLAGTPHLHFVVTTDGWAYRYASVPVTFRNGAPSETVLRGGVTYTALRY